MKRQWLKRLSIVALLLFSIGLNTYVATGRLLDADEKDVTSQIGYMHQMKSYKDFSEYISDIKHPMYQSTLYITARWLDTNNVLKPLFPFIKCIYGILKMGRNTTYAPFFAWILFFPVKLSQSFESLVFWSRFLMIGCSALTWIGITYILRYVLKIKSLLVICAALSILSCSLSYILYSSHLSSYLFGCIAQCLLLMCMFYANQKQISLVNTRFIIMFHLCFLLNHQIIFFIPLVYVTSFLSQIKKNKESQKKTLLFKTIWDHGKSALIWGCTLLPMMVIFRTLNPASNHSWEISLKSILNFSLELVFYSVAGTFLRETSWVVFSLISVTVIFFIVKGIVQLLKSKNTLKWQMGCYALCCFGVMVVLKINNLVQEGYSRHSLIIMPIVIVCIAVSFDTIRETFRSQKIIQGIGLVGICVLLIGTSLRAVDIKNNHQTTWKENDIIQILDTHTIDKIVVSHHYFFPVIQFKKIFPKWINNTSYISNNQKISLLYRESINIKPLKQGDLILFLSNDSINNQTLSKIKKFYSVDSDIHNWTIKHLSDDAFDYNIVRQNGVFPYRSYIAIITL